MNIIIIHKEKKGETKEGEIERKPNSRQRIYSGETRE
jgi:hypothetical protein